MFYWPNLKVDASTYVKSCIQCQQCKSSQGLQQPLKNLPATAKPLAQISIDLKDMYQSWNGHQYVQTVLHRYSRYVKFDLFRCKIIDKVCTNFQSYLVNYGVPNLVILDN